MPRKSEKPKEKTPKICPRCGQVITQLDRLQTDRYGNGYHFRCVDEVLGDYSCQNCAKQETCLQLVCTGYEPKAGDIPDE